MENLVSIAFVVFLLTLGGTRLWTSRCLRVLSAEQKALFLDSSLHNSVWFPLSLALFAAFIFWFPGAPLPSYYRPGIFVTYAAIPLFLSAAISIVGLIRISRLALPSSFTRGVRLAEIVYHTALLFLICSIIYLVLDALSRNQHRQTSNQAMQPTPTSFAAVSDSRPPQIQVTTGNITNTRRTGGRAGEMKIQVKLTVAGITNDAKGFRVVVAKALDDTGLDLITGQSITPEFKMTKDFELKLKNPARKAASIKELSGDVELFVPKNDPAASVMVNSFPKYMGTPIQSDTLKSAGVEIIVRTGDEYEALQQKKATEKSKKGAGPNDIALSVTGASEVVFGCEFRDQSDITIQPSGWMVMNRYRDKQEFERTLIYYFKARLPETTKLLIFVVTPGAVVKVPFALADVRLP